MTTMVSGTSIRQLNLGIKVDKATATIPQTAAQTLFTVSGGRVLVTGLLGEVTTAIGGVATTVKVSTVPTIGTGVDIASATAITSKEVGALVSLPPVAGAVAVFNAGGGGQFCTSTPYIIPTGTLTYTTSASTTGAIKWSITYVPLDDGASVA